MAKEQVDEGIGGGEPAAVTKRAGRSRKSRAIREAGRTLMDAVPDVSMKLAEEARKGNIQHMKLLLQLLNLDEGGLTPREAGPKEKTLEEILMEQWHKEP